MFSIVLSTAIIKQNIEKVPGCIICIRNVRSSQSMVKYVSMCNYFNNLNILFDTYALCLFDEVNPLMLRDNTTNVGCHM